MIALTDHLKDPYNAKLSKYCDKADCSNLFMHSLMLQVFKICYFLLKLYTITLKSSISHNLVF